MLFKYIIKIIKYSKKRVSKDIKYCIYYKKYIKINEKHRRMLKRML